MRITKLIITLAAALLLAACAPGRQPVTVSISGDGSGERRGEMIEIAADDILERLQLNDTAQFVITDAAGRMVPYQLTYDGNILFSANVPASGTVVYTVQEGTPAPFDTQVDGFTFGQGDAVLSWGNNEMSYMAVRADTSAHVATDSRYLLPDHSTLDMLRHLSLAASDAELDSTSADTKIRPSSISAAVARIRADRAADCGGVTIAGYDSLVPFGGWREYEILDNGPLRFTVKLLDVPLTIGGEKLLCTRTISLDAGRALNKVQLHIDGAAHTLGLAPRILLRNALTPAEAEQSAGLLAVADTLPFAPGENTVTYIGCTFPQLPFKASVRRMPHTAPGAGGGAGYAFALSHYKAGTDFVYYFGATRNHRRFPTWKSWIDYLSDFSCRCRTPLKVIIK